MVFSFKRSVLIISQEFERNSFQILEEFLPDKPDGLLILQEFRCPLLFDREVDKLFSFPIFYFATYHLYYFSIFPVEFLSVEPDDIGILQELQL